MKVNIKKNFVCRFYNHLITGFVDEEKNQFSVITIPIEQIEPSQPNNLNDVK